ncbi:TolC family protein, partial [Salmonella enterica subsp. enterica]|nr:TolC family protein [Salmonella enterica subsp. enterica]
MFFFKTTMISAILLILANTNSYANILKDILKNSLHKTPELIEAQANVDAANSRVKQAKAQHLPILGITGNKLLSQSHRDYWDYNNEKFIPGLKGEINIYSFGLIESEVERNEKEKLYNQFKYKEIEENIAYTIFNLYLKGLKAKESIQVKNKSLITHNKIINGLNIISDNDNGRISEYVQAEARKILVEQEINSYERELMITLSTLSKYTGLYIKENDISNPFIRMSINDLFKIFTSQDDTSNPAYLSSQAELESKQKSIDVERKKQLPKINLTGSITKNDREISIGITWDLLNFSSAYSIDEKVSQLAAARQRKDRIIRDIHEA